MRVSQFILLGSDRMKDKSTYLKFLEMVRSAGITEKEDLTDTQLALLIQKLLEYLSITAEKF